MTLLYLLLAFVAGVMPAESNFLVADANAPGQEQALVQTETDGGRLLPQLNLHLPAGEPVAYSLFVTEVEIETEVDAVAKTTAKVFLPFARYFAVATCNAQLPSHFFKWHFFRFAHSSRSVLYQVFLI